MTRRVRVIKSRGRTYLQQVEYHWDPVRKRGITRVVKHVGPKKPVNPDRYKWSRLKSTRKQLKDERQERKFRAMQRDWQKEKLRREEEYEAARESLPPIAPGVPLVELVMKAVRSLPQGGSRRSIFAALKAAGDAPDEEERHARTHVGIALTGLLEAGRIRLVKGSGKPGDPFFYAPAEAVPQSSTP